MLNLQALTGLLRDPELRQKLSRVTSAKIKADIKSLQANAELSRRLIEATTRRGVQADAAAQERMLKTVVNEHLDYFATLTDLSAAFSDRLLGVLTAMGKGGNGAGAAPPSLGMSLRGPLGSTLRAPFEIENNRADAITAVFRLTPYVSEDGGQLVAANHAFDPPRAVIPAGGKLRITFIQPITEGFAIDRDYLATISVEGLDAMQIVVRLHVDRPDERPAADAEGDTNPAEPGVPPEDTSENPEPPPAGGKERRRRRAQPGGRTARKRRTTRDDR
jgi:hypothetical protein